MRIFWRTLNGLMAALFLFSAVIQYNDPNALRWTAIYLAAAVPCVWWLWRAPPLALPVGVGAISAIWLVPYVRSGAWSVPLDQAFATWHMRTQAMLEKREMLGLMIVTGWMAILVVTAWMRRRRSSNRAA